MIAIKDMEIPKSCGDCNFCDSEGDCIILLENVEHDYTENERYDYCPLIEIEQSEDCVSRQAVIDIFNRIRLTKLEYLQTKKTLKELPPVIPTQRWIPVSERLPEEETTVLICTDQGDIDTSRIFSYSDGEWEWFASSWCYGEIIAWMPLPEPYIESEGE